jgi:Protein of unknown function (DUF4058)
MAFRLNTFLPPEYYAGVRVRLGTAFEVDIGTFEDDRISRGTDFDNSTVATALAPATLLLDTEEPTPPEYEVLVYDRKHTRRLVAAVEIVSPRNKDRAEARDAFVSKCHAMLHQEVCVVIVDPVTERSPNLYAELAARIGAEPPTTANGSIYAVSCRGIARGGRWRVESWGHNLEIGQPLPTLPLWLTDRDWAPLELETTYEETCRGLRIT